MKTEIAPAGTPNERSEAVARAVALLRAGEVVALPTETVYGLAADALSAAAVVKIFESKERPRFDPLIVHLPERGWLERVATIASEARNRVEQLIAAGPWPGSQLRTGSIHFLHSGFPVDPPPIRYRSPEGSQTGISIDHTPGLQRLLHGTLENGRRIAGLGYGFFLLACIKDSARTIDQQPSLGGDPFP